jgi:hypothetical protein
LKLNGIHQLFVYVDDINILGGSVCTLKYTEASVVASKEIGKGKVIPLQALTGPEGSRRLRLPDFKTIRT